MFCSLRHAPPSLSPWFLPGLPHSLCQMVWGILECVGNRRRLGCPQGGMEEVHTDTSDELGGWGLGKGWDSWVCLGLGSLGTDCVPPRSGSRSPGWSFLPLHIHDPPSPCECET